MLKWGLLFHIACVKFDGKSTRARGKQWKCENYKKDSSVSSKAPSDSITKGLLLSVTEELKGQLFAKITEKIEDFKTSVNFFLNEKNELENE